MTCQAEFLSNREFMRLLNHKVIEQRIPITGSIDVTRRCNLRCVHCYYQDCGGAAGRARELSTSQWKSLIDQITDAGCLFFLITGGEPMLRDDFSAIYRYARQKGLLVTVFTNGTLIGEDILACFRELPPYKVEISLYGASQAVYERITRTPGSYKRCMHGIDQLRALGVNLAIKTMDMTLNHDEYDAIQAFCRRLDIPFRSDAFIIPTMAKGPQPVCYRITPQQTVAKELALPGQIERLAAYCDTHRGPLADGLYNCGAGMIGFHISAYGLLQPCLLSEKPTYNLLEGSFAHGWREVMPKVREAPAGKYAVCNTCPKRVVCGFCAAIAQRGDEASIHYLCQSANLRYNAVTAYVRENENERE